MITTTNPRLHIVPMTLKAANAFVTVHHRHHGPTLTHRLSFGIADETGKLRGVAIVGPPVSRFRDDGHTLEVSRVATDGCPNACSALLGAAARLARLLGYTRLGTYTLETEPGTSLRAAGWQLTYKSPGGSWERRTGKPTRSPVGPKLLWEPRDLATPERRIDRRSGVPTLTRSPRSGRDSEPKVTPTDSDLQAAS